MSRGARLWRPLLHSPDYDLVAEVDGRLLRIEVKTSTRLNRRGRWDAAIATRGGNRSWSGVVKEPGPPLKPPGASRIDLGSGGAPELESRARL